MKLSDELWNLAEDIPTFVRVDPDSAWRIARRRRVRRRASALFAVALVAVLLVAGLQRMSRPIAIDPADRGARDGLTLPVRIERAFLLGDLPSKAGPLAGVIWSNNQWLAVSPTGRLWRLPLAVDDSYPPAISADGSTVAFFQDFGDGNRTRLLIWNSVTGMVRYFFHVHEGLRPDVVQAQIADQSPAYLSPDGAHLFVEGDRGRDQGVHDRALLIDNGADHRVRVLNPPKGTDSAFPAGWLDENHIVWITTMGTHANAVISTLTGAVVRTVHLAARVSAKWPTWGQWVGPVSPDGSHVAVEDTYTGVTLVFSLADGSSSRMAMSSGGFDICPLSWGSGDRPTRPNAGTELIGGGTPVVADPALHVACSIWASDALTGKQHKGVAGTLFGTNTAWWTWWWRELAVGLIAVVAIGALLWRWRHHIWH